MPGVQNPTTCLLPQKRRERIADLIDRQGLILLEDDAFGFTDDGPLAAMSALIPERGIFFGGTSKVFGAGLRISFLAAPERFWRPSGKGRAQYGLDGPAPERRHRFRRHRQRPGRGP